MAANVPLLQESLLLCNLMGTATLIDLLELSHMTMESSEDDPDLFDSKAPLLDENSLKGSVQG